MTEGEWFDLPFSPRHVLTVDKPRETEKPKTAFDVAMSDGGKSNSASDNAMNVTRETRIVEGSMQISFPRSVLPDHVTGGVPGVLELDEQEGMVHLHVSLKKIVREISKDEADKMKTLLFRPVSTGKD